MPEDHAKRVLLIGHCGPDAFALQAAVRSMVPDATVEQVNSVEALQSALADAGALLINRVLDGDFRGESGVELIRVLAAEGGPGRANGGAGLVLVSNLAAAQEEAESAGALPGFGKQELYSDRMRASLEAALGA